MSIRTVKFSVSLALLIGAFSDLLLGVVVAAAQQSDSPKEFVVPKLKGLAVLGKIAYAANCQECHGVNARGTDKGPTFLHRVYHPGHHADGAFLLAVKRGARQHHWRFGNMPAQPNLTDQQVEAIITYVRAIQKANGIF